MTLSDDDRRELLKLAAAAIRSGLDQAPISGVAVQGTPLAELGASFVTLERDGDLLGCIGTIEAVRPLFEDVMGNAYKSAFADPRLPPITEDDFATMTVKVSVLSPLEPVDATSLSELEAALRPGIDGALVADGTRRGTFLPSVWDKVASPGEFVSLLLRKAGLPSRGWRAWRYSTEEFGDYARHLMG